MPGRVGHKLDCIFRRLWRCQAGGLGAGLAIGLPVLLGATGIAVDFVTYLQVKGELQAAADGAAMAGAREIQLVKTDPKHITSSALSHAAFQLTGNSGATQSQLAVENLTVDAAVVSNDTAVQVNISRAWSPFFAHFLNAGITPVKVSATARFVGSNNLCVLGLNPSASAVFLDKTARLTGDNCGVFSNSSKSDALKINDGAVLTASINCAVGGASVSSSATVSPKPLSSCPVVPDPLASRPPPSFGGCDHTNLSYTSGTQTLSPGVYCGGLKITNLAKVTLNPGIYVIKDGDLEVSGSATAAGDNVAFYLTGATAGKLNFTSKSHISFAGPDSGPMAGILFFQDRATTATLKHKITSDDARRLIGTIYLPNGDLVVDAKTAVADQSAWTAIIVKDLELNSGPNLVLNSNYTATNVPVPEGIKGTSQVILSQ